MSDQQPRAEGQPQQAPSPSPTPPPTMAAPSPQHLPPPGTAPLPAPYLPQPRPEGGFKRGFGLGAGAGLGLGTALGIAGLIGSLIMGLMMVGALAAAGGVNTAQNQPMETIWGSPSAPNQLRAITINGPIMADGGDGIALTAATYGYEVAAMIDAIEDSEAAGLLLVINTPGGSVNGSRAIADAIDRYQQRTGNKVVAHVQGMSASGGMYAMAGADEIIADHGSLVGSIGVIYGPFSRFRDVTALTGTAFEQGVVTTGGITQEYLTQGKDKDVGNPYRDMTEEERAVLTEGMANVYDDFVTWVADSRGIPAATIKDELGAHIFDPKTAVANGLIDAEMGIEEAYRRAAVVAGVDPDQTKVVAPAVPGLLEQLLGVEGRVYGQAPALQETDGLTRVTASLCSMTPTVLLFHGSLTSVCG